MAIKFFTRNNIEVLKRNEERLLKCVKLHSSLKADILTGKYKSKDVTNELYMPKDTYSYYIRTIRDNDTLHGERIFEVDPFGPPVRHTYLLSTLGLFQFIYMLSAKTRGLSPLAIELTKEINAVIEEDRLERLARLKDAAPAKVVEEMADIKPVEILENSYVPEKDIETSNQEELQLEIDLRASKVALAIEEHENKTVELENAKLNNMLLEEKIKTAIALGLDHGHAKRIAFEAQNKNIVFNDYVLEKIIENNNLINGAKSKTLKAMIENYVDKLVSSNYDRTIAYSRVYSLMNRSIFETENISLKAYKSEKGITYMQAITELGLLDKAINSLKIIA